MQEADVAPVIADYWERAEFPYPLVPGFAALGLAGGPIKGYGCPVSGAGSCCGEGLRNAGEGVGETGGLGGGGGGQRWGGGARSCLGHMVRRCS